MAYKLFRVMRNGTRKLLSEHLYEDDAREYANRRRGVVVITDNNGVVIPWREEESS